MLEIIIILVIIQFIIRKSKKAQEEARRRQAPPPVVNPGRTASARPPVSATRTKSAPTKPAPVKPAKPTAAPQPVKQEAKAKEPERTFIEPTKPYRPAHNAGERYEEWFPVPEGKKVVHCYYCGADNLLPRNANPELYTCYFCREELK